MIFTMLSELSTSLQNSTIMGIGIDSSDAFQITEELQCRSGSLTVIYFVYPFGERMFDCKIWDHVVDIFRSRLV